MDWLLAASQAPLAACTGAAGPPQQLPAGAAALPAGAPPQQQQQPQHHFAVGLPPADPTFLYGGWGYRPSWGPGWGCVPPGGACSSPFAAVQQQPAAPAADPRFPAARAPDDPLNAITDTLLRTPHELQRRPSLDEVRQQQMQQQQGGAGAPAAADVGHTWANLRTRRVSGSVSIGLAAA